MHHVEREGEAGSFKVEAVVIDFLFSVSTSVYLGEKETRRACIPEHID